jgi:hypothetical protein
MNGNQSESRKRWWVKNEIQLLLSEREYRSLRSSCLVFCVCHAKTFVLITYQGNCTWCIPIRKWLVKGSRSQKHATLLSFGIKAKVEKGGESRMRYNCCCLKENTKPCSHLVWYFVFVMQKRLFWLLTKVIALDVSQSESGWLKAAAPRNMRSYYQWESKRK